MNYFQWGADPILLELGPLQIRWYGLLFASAFIIGYIIARWVYRIEKKPIEDLDNLFLYMMIGTVLGARLGHCLFYEADYYLSRPFEILKIWQGGLASHGAAVGIFFALYIYSKRHLDQPYFWLLSRTALTIASGGALIRLGNFFNSEILGRPSDLPWAVVFTRIDDIPRHPVMLYESLSYLVIFFILIGIYNRYRAQTRPGLILGLLFILIFGMRFVLEFFKVRQADFAAEWALSMGQWLSIPMVLFGLVLLFIGRDYSEQKE